MGYKSDQMLETVCRRLSMIDPHILDETLDRLRASKEFTMIESHAMCDLMLLGMSKMVDWTDTKRIVAEMQMTDEELAESKKEFEAKLLTEDDRKLAEQMGLLEGGKKPYPKDDEEEDEEDDDD